MATGAEPAEPGRSRYNRTITLPDGRNIGYADVGSPTGYPLFFFHGFPGSRLEARGLDELGRRHNVRVIAPDRPGYGLSTYLPTFRMTDWPRDVQSLARELGLKEFAVLGSSGGGPYALACAGVIPSEALSAVGLLASAGPWEAGNKGVLTSFRLISWAATNLPSLAARVVDLVVGLGDKLATTNTGKKLMGSVLSKADGRAGRECSQPGRQHQAAEDGREWAMRVSLEPFAQGSRAFIQEAYLLSHAYGFRLEDITRNVSAWHGTKDTNSPIHMVRYMAERMPHCALRELEGEDHFSIARHLEEVVTTL